MLFRSNKRAERRCFDVHKMIQKGRKDQNLKVQVAESKNSVARKNMEKCGKKNWQYQKYS